MTCFPSFRIPVQNLPVLNNRPRDGWSFSDGVMDSYLIGQHKHWLKKINETVSNDDV